MTRAGWRCMSVTHSGGCLYESGESAQHAGRLRRCRPGLAPSSRVNQSTAPGPPIAQLRQPYTQSRPWRWAIPEHRSGPFQVAKSSSPKTFTPQVPYLFLHSRIRERPVVGQ